MRRHHSSHATSATVALTAAVGVGCARHAATASSSSSSRFTKKKHMNTAASSSSALASAAPTPNCLTPDALYAFFNKTVLQQSDYDAMLAKRAWLHDTYLVGYDLWAYVPEAEKAVVKAKLAEWRSIMIANGEKKNKNGANAANTSSSSSSSTIDTDAITLEPLEPFVFLYGSCVAGTAFRDGDADFALTFPTTAEIGHAVVAASFTVRRAAGEDVDAEEAAFNTRIVAPALARGSFEPVFEEDPSRINPCEVFVSDGAGGNAPRLNADGTLVQDLNITGGIFTGRTFGSSSNGSSSEGPSSSSSNSNSSDSNAGSSSNKFMSQSLEANPSGSPFTHFQSSTASGEIDLTKKPFSIADLRFATKSNFFAVARIVHPQILTTFYKFISQRAMEEGIETDDDDVAKAIQREEREKKEKIAAAAGGGVGSSIASEAAAVSPPPPAAAKKKRSSILAALEDEIPVKGSTTTTTTAAMEKRDNTMDGGDADSPPKKPKLFLHRIFRARVPIMQFAPPSAMVTHTKESLLADATSNNAKKDGISIASSSSSSIEEEINVKLSQMDISESFDEDFDAIMNNHSVDDNAAAVSADKQQQTDAQAVAAAVPVKKEEESAPTTSNNDAKQKKKKKHFSESLIDRLLREDAASAAPLPPPPPTTPSSRFTKKGSSPNTKMALTEGLGGSVTSTGSSLLDEVLSRGAHANTANTNVSPSSSSVLPEPKGAPSSSSSSASSLGGGGGHAAAPPPPFSSAAIIHEAAHAKVALTGKTFSRFFKSREQADEAAMMAAKVPSTILKAAEERYLGGGGDQSSAGGDGGNAGRRRSRFVGKGGRVYDSGQYAEGNGLAASPHQQQQQQKTTREGGSYLSAASIPPLVGSSVVATASSSSAAAAANLSGATHVGDAYSLQKRDERHLASTPTAKDKKEHMDLSVALEGCRNTLLVREYMRAHPIAVRGATMVLKHWGRRQQILNARRGWLSPYALTIMFIHCLHEHKVIGGLVETVSGVDKVLGAVADFHNNAKRSQRQEQKSAGSGNGSPSLKPDIELVLPAFPHPSSSPEVLREYQRIPDLMRLFFCYYGGISDPAAVVAASSFLTGRGASAGNNRATASSAPASSPSTAAVIAPAPHFDFDYNVVDIRPAPDRYTLRSSWDAALFEQLGVDTSRHSLHSEHTRGGVNNGGGEALNLNLFGDGTQHTRTKTERTATEATNTSSTSSFSSSPAITINPRFAHLDAAAQEELLKAARRERWHRLGHEAILIRDPYEDHSLGRSVEFFHAEAIREEFRHASTMRYGGLDDAADFFRT